MKYFAKPLSTLINQLSKLQGIGHKTAQKLAFDIINMDIKEAEDIAYAIIDAKKNMKYCSICGNITQQDPCSICTDETRKENCICVVESTKDMVALEKMGEFKGRYHILNGVISPLEGIGPDDINLKSLIIRLQNQDIDEIILATNPTIEGEATAMYIARIVKPAGIKVSRIAHGIPVGGDLEYIDEVTLSKAFEGRKIL